MTDTTAKMSVLVACKDCRRHYDASELPLGALFHCYCGQLVKVPEVTAKDASVVRCSACGAARNKAAKACEHCRADFTAHERDMHTTCPDCLSRISDRARFCHHCGTRIGNRLPAGSPTERSCPACSGTARLCHRQLGEATPVLECSKCAGVWLSHDTVDQVIRRSREIAATHVPDANAARAYERPELPRQTGPLYRRCPMCDEMMSRVNHGRQSGVVVDRCHDHGVWFDEQELAAVVAWVRSGGERRAEMAQAEAVRAKSRRDGIEALARGGAAPGAFSARGDTDDSPAWIEILGRLF